ncbi:hypothetical protein [Streptomyces sp. NPDC049040]|uniref:hypothetical protein n=1 Tax=Streptomyces sp. NPDC049040 TaxID=3365593 RepID=UPI00371EF134
MTASDKDRPWIESDRITAAYLEACGGQPVRPMPETEAARTMYGGRYLSRPVFLGTAEQQRLESDLGLLRECLTTLPARLFGGDPTSFARAIGFDDLQVHCALRSRSGRHQALTRMARADLFRDGGGFRLLEWNLGSTAGGTENADMCRAVREQPGMRRFLASERLAFADTRRELVRTLREETGFPEGTAPVVALVEWPDSYPYMERYLRRFAADWARFGLSTVTCHLGELTRSGGRLRLGDQQIDVVYRFFMIEDLVRPGAQALLEPLLQAAERDEVRVFTPLDAELFGSKGALALLSTQEGQDGLTPEQRKACGRLLPWTRLVRPGPTLLPDGRVGDLLEYATAHRRELVLKPTALHGGKGVTLGWLPDVTSGVWRDRLAEAVGGPWVVQQGVQPVPEWFPDPEGGPAAPWSVAWGVYSMAAGHAGILVRALPASGPLHVVSHANGAHFGCGFHALGPSRP